MFIRCELLNLILEFFEHEEGKEWVVGIELASLMWKGGVFGFVKSAF